MRKQPTLRAFILHCSLYGASTYLFSQHVDRYQFDQEGPWLSLLQLSISLYMLWHVLRDLEAFRSA